MEHPVDGCICGSGVQEKEESEPEYRFDHYMNTDDSGNCAWLVLSRQRPK